MMPNITGLFFVILFLLLISIFYLVLRLMDTIFGSLEPLTVLDPLLLYGFIYICPRYELSLLLSKVNPFISMLYMAKLFRDAIIVNIDEVRTLCLLYNCLKKCSCCLLLLFVVVFCFVSFVCLFVCLFGIKGKCRPPSIAQHFKP